MAKAKRYVSWLGHMSKATGNDFDKVLADALEWVHGPHYREWGTFPVLVRVTEGPRQNPVYQVSVTGEPALRLHDPDYPVAAGEYVFGGMVYRDGVL